MVCCECASVYMTVCDYAILLMWAVMTENPKVCLLFLFL